MKFSPLLHPKYHSMSSLQTNGIFDFENILTDPIGDFNVPEGDDFTTPPCMNPLSDAYRPGGTPTLEWASLLMQPERLVFEDEPPTYEESEGLEEEWAFEVEVGGGGTCPACCSPFELAGDGRFVEGYDMCLACCRSAFNPPAKKTKVDAPPAPPNTPEPVKSAKAPEPVRTPEPADDECPVCYEVITNETGLVRPRCGHSVCMGCFEKMASVKAVNCPMCRVSMGNFDLRMEPEEIEMTTEERYDHVHLVADVINETPQFRDVAIDYMRRAFNERFGERPFSEADTKAEDIFMDLSFNSRFVNYCASYVGMVATDLTVEWVNYDR